MPPQKISTFSFSSSTDCTNPFGATRHAEVPKPSDACRGVFLNL
jgi:hypothetical protein